MRKAIVSNNVYFPSLDGFRALAAIWILFHHLIYIIDLKPFLKSKDIFSYSIVKIGFVGFLGVDIFFVISGFLITGLLIGDLEDKVRIKRFYIRRLIKIRTVDENY